MAVLTAVGAMAGGGTLAWSGPRMAPEPWTFCPGFPGPARLSPSGACLSPEVCLGSLEWDRWLRTGSALCGSAIGRWRFGAQSLKDETAHKPVRREFRAPFWSWRASPGWISSLWHRALHLLEVHRARLSALLEPGDRGGVLRSLLLGETGMRASGLRRIGFIHVLSPTGLHLYAVASLVSWLVLGLSEVAGIPVTAGLALRAALVTVVWGWGWLLAGTPRAMLRPLSLIALRGVARKTGLRWRRWSPVLLAIGFDAAIGILHGNGPSRLTERLGYALAVGGTIALAGSAVRVAIGAWLLLGLLDVWRSGLLELATPLISFFTIPWIAGIVYPASLALSVGGPLDRLAVLNSTVLEALSRAMIRWPTLLVIEPPTLVASGLAAFCVLVFVQGLRRSRVLASCAVVALSFAFHRASAATSTKGIQIEQLDVGQGDCALVVDPGTRRTGLIDAGGPLALSERDWMEVLARHGASRLDWVLLTHLDADHSGGLRAISRVVPVGCVATGRDEAESPRGVAYFSDLSAEGVRRLPLAECVPFPTFTAHATAHGRAHTASGNVRMTSVLIPLEPGFYLSPGDSDAEEEHQVAGWLAGLESENPALLSPPHLLKVSHHGSRFSSDGKFIDAVHPDEAWISSGVGNLYGHPSIEALLRFETRGIPVFRTDQQGAIAFTGGGGRRRR